MDNAKNKKNIAGERPAYIQLAEQIKRDILNGVYRPGDRTPTETALSRTTGLSPLTVRQALGQLVEEGILERFVGRGTYVKKLSWRGASFNIDGLARQITQQEARVRIVRTEVRKASAEMAVRLNLSLGDSLIYLKRTIASPEGVFLVQEAHIKPDPRRPILEAELEATYLSGLFTGDEQSIITMATLAIDPTLLSEEDARLLERPEASAAFCLEYEFFDAEAMPLACGFFITPKEVLRLKACIGINAKMTAVAEER